ncbi:MAG: hypothetical protein ACKOX0_06270 [Bacteroidota bacterium]
MKTTPFIHLFFIAALATTAEAGTPRRFRKAIPAKEAPSQQSP